MSTIRVAAAQFCVGNNVEDNLATVLRMIDNAAAHKPDLLVLPEFCNHLSWYENIEHCFDVSIALDGAFTQAVLNKAKEHGFYIVLNATAQREGGTATGTSILLSPEGEVITTSDKQVLIGHENDFLERAKNVCPVIETPIGRLGMYACMDGVINETPRDLALRGAQVLCNSLNSFALDEASLHVPVRAAENKVFVVAANKVGPLIPEELVEPVSQQTSIPVRFLNGAGESQIVAPDGTVLAKASETQEEVIFADIDVSLADDKTRPDGTDVFKSRRPALYKAIGEAPQPATYAAGAPEVVTSVYQPQKEGFESVEEAANAILEAASAGTRLLVLPELFCFSNAKVTDPQTDYEHSKTAIETLKRACAEAGTGIHIATSLVLKTETGYQHAAVLISEAGLVFKQGQLHASQRHSWTETATTFEVLQLPWARIALMVGDDSIYPETFRLAAFQHAEIAAVPMHMQEDWELTTGLLERSAENRICLVAATRRESLGKSLVTTLHKDFTIMTPWETRPFDGHLSYPIATAIDDEAKLTTTTVHPENTQNKVVSLNTHLIDGRPWHLVPGITQETVS